MEIKVSRIKQYNSTHKNVIMVDGKPICIVAGQKITSNCVAYLQGYDVEINDGAIKNKLDKMRGR